MTLVSETLQVSGVRCERCVMRLGGALRRLDGIEAANANLMGEVSLTWDGDRLDRETIVEALARAGFRQVPAAA
jgi:copper chaperone CopZ